MRGQAQDNCSALFAAVYFSSTFLPCFHGLPAAQFLWTSALAHELKTLRNPEYSPPCPSAGREWSRAPCGFGHTSSDGPMSALGIISGHCAIYRPPRRRAARSEAEAP